MCLTHSNKWRSSRYDSYLNKTEADTDTYLLLRHQNINNKLYLISQIRSVAPCAESYPHSRPPSCSLTATVPPSGRKDVPHKYLNFYFENNPNTEVTLFPWRSSNPNAELSFLTQPLSVKAAFLIFFIVKYLCYMTLKWTDHCAAVWVQFGICWCLICHISVRKEGNTQPLQETSIYTFYCSFVGFRWLAGNESRVVTGACGVVLVAGQRHSVQNRHEEVSSSESWSWGEWQLVFLHGDCTVWPCTLLCRHLQLSCPCGREGSLSQTCSGKTWWRRRRGTVLTSRRHSKELFLDTSHQWVCSSTVFIQLLLAMMQFKDRLNL